MGEMAHVSNFTTIITALKYKLLEWNVKLAQELLEWKVELA